MNRTRRLDALSTRTLLVCAAIGVATGLVSALAGYLSVPVAASIPVIYGLIFGAHVLPGVVGQDVLRLPGVAILTHLLAALVSTAFSPAWAGRYIGCALLVGGLQEGIAALGRYRSWATWRYLISSIIIGGALALIVGLAGAAEKFSPVAKLIYLSCWVIGPVAWTLAGVAVARALRRAGIR